MSSLCVNFRNIGNVQFSALFSYMLWHIELKFCIWLCFTVLQIKFECRQFLSIFVGVMPLFIRPSSDGTYYGMVMSVRPGLRPSVRPSVHPSVRPSIRPSVRHSFPHFSPTCFDILIWNFVYHFIFMHVRSSSNAINFRHFLQELCSFLTSNSFKYAVFRTFLLHALTYWVQILYMTLFLCNTEQVWVSSFCFNFCMSYASLWT